MLERRRMVLGMGLAAFGCLLLPPLVSAAADPLPKPKGEIILIITGAIGITNGDGMAAFDLAMLEALPARQFVSETPWTRGLHTFTGVPLKVLMARVGASGRTITATALNDYTAEIPIDDGERFELMVAYLLDGQPMLPSDRGPLWTVYPFSNRPETRTETYYMRSVWTLESFRVH
jgi:hypothetical protein